MNIKQMMTENPLRIRCPVEGCAHVSEGVFASSELMTHFEKVHPEKKIADYIPIKMEHLHSKVTCGECNHSKFHLMQRPDGTRYLECTYCGNEAVDAPNFVRGKARESQ